MASESEDGQPHTRPRREDHPSANHGLPFSKWKVLIGPSDWQDHSSGKEGAERYRIHNIPEEGVGVYELGISAAPSDDSRTLHESCIVPVYVGASANFRTRLQCYGRDGDHLHRLFSEIFQKGLPILFRCAPMKSREEAGEKEAELLNKFDYAWNKECNGRYRRHDIWKKLGKMDSCTASPSRATRKGKEKAQEKIGLGPTVLPCPTVRINDPHRPRRTQEPRSSCSGNGAEKEEGLLPTMCQTRHLEGRKLPPKREEEEDHEETYRCNVPSATVANEDNICGVKGGDGSICRNLPDKGRRRCSVHKGQRVDGKETYGYNPSSVTIAGDDNTCGAVRADGSICRNHVEKGRRRCGVHKGQKVNIGGSGIAEGREVYTDGGQSSICRVSLADGSICMESPVLGRKRCEEHKGRKVVGASLMGGSSSRGCEAECYVSSSVCGVTMGNGYPCMAAPVPGRRRCGRHKGRWA